MNLTRLPVTFLKNAAADFKFRRERKRWHHKISRLHQKCMQRPAGDGSGAPELDIPGHKSKWQPLVSDVNSLWYETYSHVSGRADIEYVPGKSVRFNI